MSENVVADPVFSIARVLKPPARFEALYQGQPSGLPVAMPGTLDPDAGRPGFDPRLVAGIPVPIGAKLLLWFPGITNTESPLVAQPYTYALLWRLRNVVDFRNRRMSYHLSKQAPGVTDTSVPYGGTRFTYPAATESVVFNQPEPAGAFGVAFPNLRREALSVVAGGVSTFPPIVPGAPPPVPQPVPPLPAGSGISTIQQGVFDPTSFAPGLGFTATNASFLPYFTTCKGDELLVFAVRTDQAASAIWDFTTADRGFSNVYGRNVAGPQHAVFDDIGIFVLTGVSPT